ncbi:hypothetical protein [Zavarzinella formosa]|uniref:hypothetical protein n=1 Tax=Zavarzinella formosa TaxID=360055 RepID=UPI0002ECB0D4|nr:hypothetical protein [Zavarzinella formosa]
MTIQAIVRHTSATAMTFTGKPSEETRRGLLAAGYSFDGRSKQWYVRAEEIVLVTEEQVARDIGVAA